MAEVQWPVSLQSKVNADSFKIAWGETVLRSDMDIGPAKVRRRFTKGVDVMSCAINLTVEQYDTFETFYKTLVNGGATRFEINHPISQDVVLVRFTGPPEIAPLGGVMFRAAFELEVLP